MKRHKALKIKAIIKGTFVIIGILILLMAIIYNLPEEKKEFKTRNFTFIYSANTDSIKVKGIADTLEKSYHRISRDLNTTPANNIKANIYGSRWRYGKATGNWGASGSVEGPTQLHFLEQAFVNDNSKQVVLHEFTHAVVLKMLIDQQAKPFDNEKFEQKFATFPVWLWESISCYEAGEIHDLKNMPYLANGTYPSLRELTSRKGNKVYFVGYSIIEFIIQRFGHDKFLELISNYGNLQKVLAISDEEFSKEWYSFVRAKYL